MDNELSTGVMMAIELIVLSAVIGFVMLFAGIGQQFQRTTLELINNDVASAYGSDLESMSENEGILPAATVYLILERNADIIQSVTGNIDRRFADNTVKKCIISSKENLLEFFDTKIKTSVTRTAGDMYAVRVESSR
jgi:hypothetical protein